MIVLNGRMRSHWHCALVSDEIVSAGSVQLDPGCPGTVDPHVEPWCCEQLAEPVVAHEQGTRELLGTVNDVADDEDAPPAQGDRGGMVPFLTEHPTPAGPYVGAFVGAFRVEPID